jgi:hypothetical protein
MSHFGINERMSTRNLEIFNPFIARFKGSRGFNTIGGRYMDIGKNFSPEGVQISIDDIVDKSRNTFESLAFYVEDGTLQKIAQREGFPFKLMSEIRNSLNDYNKKRNTQEGQKDIAEYLWIFYLKQDISTNYQERIHQYRKELDEHNKFEILNTESYVPHPVKVECKQKNMIVFGLISIRTDIGAKKNYTNDIGLMTFRKAIHSANPPRELYFKDCILGGVHGINVRDILSGMGDINGEMDCYIENLKEIIKEEWDNTQSWKFHGNNLHANLVRSGLLDYFPEILIDL